MPSTKIFPSENQLKYIGKIWWPLALSWALMSITLPIMSGIIARMPYPEINLAAMGGIVFPLSLIIESPVVMLLAGSIVLCKDWDSYKKVQSFMLTTGGVLTLVHILVSISVIYDNVVVPIIGAPSEIVEISRQGLIMMIPWSMSIGYRRFNQGILIRYGHTRAIGTGTVIRVATLAIVMSVGYILEIGPGVVVGAMGLTASVIAEAIYTGLRVRPVIKRQLMYEPQVDPLTWKAFTIFYLPLALTTFLNFLWQPLGSAAMSRMPGALQSLAVWPVLTGVVFLFRSFGLSYNEAVISLLKEKNSYYSLRTFTWILSVGIFIAFLVFASTPLSSLWFKEITSLTESLSELASIGTWFVVVVPLLSGLQSWYQGAIVYSEKTRGIPESLIINVLVAALILFLGISFQNYKGLYYTVFALSLANLAQTFWLWFRSRHIFKQVKLRDSIEGGN